MICHEKLAIAALRIAQTYVNEALELLEGGSCLSHRIEIEKITLGNLADELQLELNDLGGD